MSHKNKDKNQYGTFLIGKANYKKYARLFITALVVVIFILGAGILIVRGHQKPKVQAVVQTTVSAIPGWWLQQYFGKSVCDQPTFCGPDADPDHDGLTNFQEYYYHTDPLNAFTVKDKLNDGQLVAHNFDPSKPGHVTFDQVISQDNILGESLVFDTDIKQLINQEVNRPVSLPVVQDSEINISKDNSSQAVSNYLAASNKVISKYFPTDIGTYIKASFNSGTPSALDDVKTRVVQSVAELKKISVPSDFAQLHKYTIEVLQLLPDVLAVPGNDILSDDTNPIGNAWYDKAQALMVLNQKVTLESQRLQNKYK